MLVILINNQSKFVLKTRKGKEIHVGYYNASFIGYFKHIPTLLVRKERLIKLTSFFYPDTQTPKQGIICRISVNVCCMWHI